MIHICQVSPAHQQTGVLSKPTFTSLGEQSRFRKQPEHESMSHYSAEQRIVFDEDIQACINRCLPTRP